jgi:hypothetical protein
MSDEKIIEDAVKLAEKAKAPGTFSILNVLKERAYPKDEAKVFLDEQAAYDAAGLQQKISELSKSADLNVQDEIDALIAKRDELVERIENSKYVFHITGISEKARSDAFDKSVEKFPIEYEESKNPFSGEVNKTEIESKERDRLFTNILWSLSIEKIVAPDGGVQENMSVEDIASLRDMLPLAAAGVVNQSIDKIRTSTALFMISVDEDFLAKS